MKQRDQLDTLSGGKKRKIILNDALRKDSQILLLDEPESFLDMESQERLLKHVKEHKQDKITIIVTHSDLFIDAADEVILLYA